MLQSTTIGSSCTEHSVSASGEKTTRTCLWTSNQAFMTTILRFSLTILFKSTMLNCWT